MPRKTNEESCAAAGAGDGCATQVIPMATNTARVGSEQVMATRISRSCSQRANSSQAKIAHEGSSRRCLCFFDVFRQPNRLNVFHDQSIYTCFDPVDGFRHAVAGRGGDYPSGTHPAYAGAL